MTDVLSYFLRRFQDLRVAVIGDAVLDTFVDGRPHKLCSEGPVPVVWKEAQSEAPGGAANVAANAAALGARTRLVGLIGPDPAGGRLRSQLERYGVDLSLLLESPSCTTHRKTRILAGGQYVVRVDEGDTTARARRLTAAVEAVQAHADVVILSDYGLGLLSDALIGRLAALRTQVPVIVDAKRPSRYRRLRPTAVTPNLEEAAALLRRSAGPLRLAQRAHAVTRADLVALTLGERGVFLLDGAGQGELLPARPVRAQSAVGAGDSFVAALALALAAGCTPRDAVIMGVETSGIAVAKPHTAVVTAGELERSLTVLEASPGATAHEVAPGAAGLVSRVPPLPIHDGHLAAGAG